MSPSLGGYLHLINSKKIFGPVEPIEPFVTIFGPVEPIGLIIGPIIRNLKPVGLQMVR